MVPFRKSGHIYAVPEPRGKHKASLKRFHQSDDDDDDDSNDFQPTVKQVRSHSSESRKVLSEIKEVRKDLQSFLKLSSHMKTKLPPGLFQQLYDTFKCHICQASPMKPPIIFARCCRRIVGCQECVDSWYHGEEEGVARTCPLCRSERAYAETTILRGLDDLLLAIVPLLTDHDSVVNSPDRAVIDEDDLPVVTLQ